MKILAIDPGPEKSAFVVFDGTNILDKGLCDNAMLRRILLASETNLGHVAIEAVENYGKIVGASTFQTCVQIGRFIQTWSMSAMFNGWESVVREHTMIPRREVKMALCGTNRTNDAGVRNALIDRFPATGKNGKGESTPIGTKKHPGPLYGISSHVWSALAVAVTFFEKHHD